MQPHQLLLVGLVCILAVRAAQQDPFGDEYNGFVEKVLNAKRVEQSGKKPEMDLARSIAEDHTSKLQEGIDTVSEPTKIRKVDALPSLQQQRQQRVTHGRQWAAVADPSKGPAAKLMYADDEAVRGGGKKQESRPEYNVALDGKKVALTQSGEVGQGLRRQRVALQRKVKL